MRTTDKASQRGRFWTRLAVRLVGASFAAPFVNAAEQSTSRPPEAAVERLMNGSALVGFSWVDQPQNRILLIQNKRSTCAIRFVSYHRADNARPATSFDTGDAGRFAEYEVAEISQSGTAALIGAVERKELADRGLRGLGRIAFQAGDNQIRCGGEKYSWLFPTGLFWRKDQSDLMVAPTNWSNFNDVRLTHSKVQWFRRDPEQGRPFIVIPMEELAP